MISTESGVIVESKRNSVKDNALYFDNLSRKEQRPKYSASIDFG
jgi:hypothetical protein